MNKSYLIDDRLPQKLFEHLIGTKDYHKIVSTNNKNLTLIHTFNVHGNLDKTAALPTEMVALEMKKDSDNTVEMYLNNGWQLNFRILNADSMVEPNLRFAIKFEGMPPSVLHLKCRWN